MKSRKQATTEPPPPPKYPGVPLAEDGSAAVVLMETAGSEAAGAYPITPSTQMGEGWAVAVAAGKHNVNGRKLIFFEPEGEHAAAAVTAGMNMVGLRSTNFSSGQGIAYMHESLYAAVGKRLSYVLNIAARAMTKHALNVHAGHDDYHAVDDTGFFQLFAKNVQEIADLNLIAHRIAELSLNPGLVAQDGFLTSHVIESFLLPEREMIKEYLGDPSDLIDSPTPAQRLVFGERRRRIPEMFDLDYPALLGSVQNQDAYAQGVAAQRPFYFDHVADLADQAMAEFATLTGRRYARATGYRLDDAEYVLVAQGSGVYNAEEVCDYLRDSRGLKVGILNMTMFRPFPADLVTHLLQGKKAVAVLERADQPLAVDQPILREIRAATSKALENGRAVNGLPHPGVAAYAPGDVPEFYSGCYGLGSRDLQPGDLVAAVENMLEDGKHQRIFYLGIDFVRDGTDLPKLEIWQQQLLKDYPHLKDLALPGPDLNLLPPGSVSIRIHSIGGWGAITTGKNLAVTSSDLLGLHIKANPKYGSEKKGQPTTFYASLSPQPIRLNCELKHVDVVLSPDPNVFRHSDPLAGLADGGVFIIQSDLEPEALWESFPRTVQRAFHERKLKLFALDGFKIASEEASDPELRYRMQGAAFMGGFFHAAPLMTDHGLDEERLFEGIGKQLQKKFGHLGERVVKDNVRVIRRGFDEIREIDVAALAEAGEEAGRLPRIPVLMDRPEVRDGMGSPGRFWEQVGYFYKTGGDGLADPFAAMSAMPAASSSLRDMTDVRFEVPEFIADKCTGCAQCWTQCPDSAIPGLVNSVNEVIGAAIKTAESNGESYDRLRQVVQPLAKESRAILRESEFTTFADVFAQAYEKVIAKMSPDAERKATLDAEFEAVHALLVDFPLAKTAPFFDLVEKKEKDSGGLLSITVNPDTCKGCNLCVEVCPDEALVTVKQTDATTEKLRRNWRLWENLPDTADRYVNIASLEEGIGVLSSMLLKKDVYRSMFGGDGSCMGCGEKTAMHLLLSAVNALLLPKVKRHVERLDDLIARLDERGRKVLAADVDLDQVVSAKSGQVDVALDDEAQAKVERINKMLHDLKDLRWRYTAGPSGNGRAMCGFSNATGCSSVWGSTYPYNPYPFPWVNHLFQDAPSVAIGIFEGHMRKMADGFKAIRRAELELADEYDPAEDEKFLADFDWRQFSDEEFALCPPIFGVGGDGAMMDIGFQNLSRMMASGKPLRAIILDTQVYSNTGGQACTSGFTGQVSDMAAYGAGQHGKEETRKELALIGIAHRGTYVLQSSQASPSHLLGGVLRGLQARRPAIFILHCPCPPEHGIGDAAAVHQAKLALESRAVPMLVYDPDAGPALAESLSLDGNPAQEDRWPTYDLTYVDDEGEEATMTLPLTIADWAASETRFKKHFRPIKADQDGDLVPFHEYLDLPADERDEAVPFIYVLDYERRRQRMSVSSEIVELAQDRLHFWSQLRQLAGQEVTDEVRDEVEEKLEEEFSAKAEALRAEYEAKMAELKASYPQVIGQAFAQLVAQVEAGGLEAPPAVPVAPIVPAAPAPAVEPAVAGAPAEAPPEEEGLVMEPYIDPEGCTTCDECTNLNPKMFAYDDKKKAYIKDPKAGKFKDLVMAAEKCTAGVIHPGTPLNPKEKDLDKWVKRAERFN